MTSSDMASEHARAWKLQGLHKVLLSPYSELTAPRSAIEVPGRLIFRQAL